MKHSPEFTHSYTQTLPDGREVDVELAFTGYYDPGRCYGPPEDCYPPDGEVNIHQATTDEDGEMDFDAWATKHGIPEKDLKDIEDMLMERIQEGD
jgi:hypothetical protein